MGKSEIFTQRKMQSLNVSAIKEGLKRLQLSIIPENQNDNDKTEQKRGRKEEIKMILKLKVQTFKKIKLRQDYKSCFKKAIKSYNFQ